MFNKGDVVQLAPIFRQVLISSRGSGVVVDKRGDNLWEVEWTQDGCNSLCLCEHLELVERPLSLEEMLRKCLE
jgi:hypothetical protein